MVRISVVSEREDQRILGRCPPITVSLQTRHWFGLMGKDRYLVEKSVSYGAFLENPQFIDFIEVMENFPSDRTTAQTPIRLYAILGIEEWTTAQSGAGR